MHAVNIDADRMQGYGTADLPASHVGGRRVLIPLHPKISIHLLYLSNLFVFLPTKKLDKCYSEASNRSETQVKK